MPARQICSIAGCPEFAIKGEARCVEHRPGHTWDTSNRTKPPGWKNLRKKVIARDKGRCVKCGRVASVVDHYLPTAWGGTDKMSNLRAMCGTCHTIKTTEEASLGRAMAHEIDAARKQQLMRVFAARWRR